MRVVLLLFAAAVAALIVVFFAIVRSSGGEGVDCSGFTLRPGQWQAARADDRSDLQQKIAGCRSLSGRSPAAVQALLGAPDRGAGGPEYAYLFAPGDPRLMYVRFDGGRVVQVGRTNANGPVP